MAGPLPHISNLAGTSLGEINELVDELNAVLSEVDARFARLALLAEELPGEAADDALADASTRINDIVRIVRDMGRAAS